MLWLSKFFFANTFSAGIVQWQSKEERPCTVSCVPRQQVAYRPHVAYFVDITFLKRKPLGDLEREKISA